MPLKPVSQKCKLEVYGPDEEGPARLICANVVDCPLEHPGLIGLDCFGPIIIKNLDFTKGGSVQIGDLVVGAGSVVPDAGVQPPVPPESAGSRPEASERSPLPQSRTAPGTPEVEPGAGNTANRGRVPPRGKPLVGGKETETESERISGAGEQGRIGDSNPKSERLSFVGSVTSGGIPAAVPDSHINNIPSSDLNKIISHDVPVGNAPSNASGSEKTFSENSSPPDSHMVVGDDEKWWIRDLRREQAIQHYVNKLNEISMEMYLEQGRPIPPPIPILGPRESAELLKQLDDFKLTDEQKAFYRQAIERFGNRRLKQRKRHIVKQSGGMIRMPGNKPEPPEREEENLFEVDDEMYGLVLPKVKPEPEVQKPLPTVERPEEPEEEEEEDKESLVPAEQGDEDIDFLIDDMSTTGTPELGGYVLDLEVQTDEDGDHIAVMTIDNVTIEIMLDDFIEIVEALGRQLPRMREIQSS